MTRYYLFTLLSFNLQVYTINTQGEKNLMWSVSGNKGKKWNYANVLVGDNLNFSVVFEGTQGDPGTSDISIDDITLTPECATGSKSNITVDTLNVSEFQSLL